MRTANVDVRGSTTLRSVPRRLLLPLLALLVVLAVPACSSDGAAAPAWTTAATGPTGSTEAPENPPPVEEFEGSVEDFYVVPDPLPAGERGSLIRTQVLDDAPEGEVGLRIMYLSEDVLGRPRAVTGVLYYPEGAAPSGGWPIVATAHGTTGIAAECAPSRMPLEPRAFGVEGVRSPPTTSASARSARPTRTCRPPPRATP